MLSSPTGPLKRKPLFKKKQPLFKKNPIVTSTTPQDPSALFSRADSNYKAVIEDAEKRIAKRAAKQEQRKRQAEGQGVAKRRRSSSSSLSLSSDEDEGVAVGEVVRGGHREQLLTPVSPVGSKTVQQAVSPLGKGLVEDHLFATEVEKVDWSDRDLRKTDEVDEQDVSFTSLNQVGIPTQADIEDEEDEDYESDEELAAIARQAREAARKKRELDRIKSKAEARLSTEEQAILKPEKPTFQLIIESRIPGTSVLSFKVRLDGVMSRVRWSWCERNDFDSRPSSSHDGAGKITSNEIVLMFRGRRVYDINTPSSLGISVDDLGNSLIDGQRPVMAGFPDDTIVMEAIRESEIDEYVQKWDKTHGRRHADDEDANEDVSEELVVPVVKERSIKIICRTKDRKDFKLLVKSSTTIESIQDVYINEHELEDMYIAVFIDGEAQNPGSTMQELDVEDMDVLEIHLRRRH